MRKAIIGGTGVYEVDGSSKSIEVNTPYGNVNVDIVTYKETEIVFLPRHGKGHSVPPHLINYRANMMALKELDVSHVYATCAVGSCNLNYSSGDIVVMTDFLDFTKSRPNTFYDGKEGVKHVDMTEPYCKHLRNLFYDKNKEPNKESTEEIDIKGDAVYVCTEGPRFETKSEISMFKLIGGDVVGMTNVPEVVLAKELGMCYCAIGIITNWCTGIKKEEIVIHEIQSLMAMNKEKITKVFMEILAGTLNQDECSCKDAVMSL